MSREDMERTAGMWLQRFNSGELSEMITLAAPEARFVGGDSDDALLDLAFGSFIARDEPSYTIVSSEGNIVSTLRRLKRNTPTLTGTLADGWIIDENQQTVSGQVIWRRPEEPDAPTARGRLLFRLSHDGREIQSIREQHEAVIVNGMGLCPCCQGSDGPETWE